MLSLLVLQALKIKRIIYNFALTTNLMKQKECVSHCDFVIYMIHEWTMDKHELTKFIITQSNILRQIFFYENSIISPMQKYNLKQKSSQKNQNPSRFHNSINNVMFKYKPKYHVSKNPRRIFHSWFSIEGFRVFEDHPCVLLV